MKRVFALVLTVILYLLVTGCAGNKVSVEDREAVGEWGAVYVMEQNGDATELIPNTFQIILENDYTGEYWAGEDVFVGEWAHLKTDEEGDRHYRMTYESGDSATFKISEYFGEPTLVWDTGEYLLFFEK